MLGWIFHSPEMVLMGKESIIGKSLVPTNLFDPVNDDSGGQLIVDLIWLFDSKYRQVLANGSIFYLIQPIIWFVHFNDWVLTLLRDWFVWNEDLINPNWWCLWSGWERFDFGQWDWSIHLKSSFSVRFSSIDKRLIGQYLDYTVHPINDQFTVSILNTSCIDCIPTSHNSSLAFITFRTLILQRLYRVSNLILWSPILPTLAVCDMNIQSSDVDDLIPIVLE